MNPQITFTLSNRLIISGADDQLIEKIDDTLTVLNPQWLKNERFGKFNGRTEKFFRYAQTEGASVIVPRGFMKQAYRMCADKYDVRIVDNRRTLPNTDLYFLGKLHGYQDVVREDVKKKDFAIIIVPTGGGKTVIGSCMIAERQQPTLVIVPNTRLLKQWCEEVPKFLAILPESIGVYGNGKRTIGSSGLTIGIINSVFSHKEELVEHFGHLIIDECHHAASNMYRDVLSFFDTKYMLGLTATLARSDGLEKCVTWCIGETVAVVDPEELKAQGYILDVKPIFRKTAFTFGQDADHAEWKKKKPPEEMLFSDKKAYRSVLKEWKKAEPVTASNDYTGMLKEMTLNEDRNRLIVSDVLKEIGNQNGNGGVCLILSDRKAHCELLAKLLRDAGVNADYLHGELSGKRQDEIVGQMQRGEIAVVAATGQMIGEGFDCKKLTSLFLATPVKFEGRILQYLGRIMRPEPGKEKPKVYDYVDKEIGVLKNQSRVRRRAYGTFRIEKK